MFKSLRTRWHYYTILGSTDNSFYWSLEKLSSIKTAESAELIFDILKTKSDLTIEQKTAIYDALVFIGPPAVDVLMNNLYDISGKLISEIVSVLGQIRSEKPLPVFLSLYNDLDIPVLAEALGNIGSKDALDSLYRRAINPTSQSRVEAIQAIGKIKHSSSVSFLTDFLFERNSLIRRFSYESLKNLGWQEKTNHEKILRLGIEDKWEDIFLIEDSDLTIIKVFLESDRTEDRSGAIIPLKKHDSEQSANLVLSMLKDKIPSIRTDALKALARMKKVPHFHDVILLLSDEEQKVREEAEKCLINASSLSIDSIVQALDNIDQIAGDVLLITRLQSVCTNIGHNLLDKLIPLLDEGKNQKTKQAVIEIFGETRFHKASEKMSLLANDESENIRLVTAWAFGELNDETSLDVLKKLAVDVNFNVRSQAYDSLGYIMSDRGEEKNEIEEFLKNALKNTKDPVERKIIDSVLFQSI